MAVILTNMDIPVNCWECDLNNGHFCDITSNSIEDFMNVEEREKECPLKSTDEMIAEIEKLRGCSCNNSDGIIDDVVDIIEEYCKENTDEKETC